MGDTLKPLTIGELLDRSFSLYRKNFLLFIGIAALPNLIPVAFAVVTALLPPPGVLVTILSLSGSFLCVSLRDGACARSDRRGGLPHSPRPVNEHRRGARSHPAASGYLALTILNMGLRILLGLLLLILPGVVLAIHYALAVPVAVIEGRVGADALSRSSDLVQGSRGRIFVIYLLLVLLLVIGSLLWEVPATILLLVLNGSIDAASTMLGQIVIQFPGQLPDANDPGSDCDHRHRGHVLRSARAKGSVRPRAHDVQQLNRGTPQPSPVP